MLEFFYLSSVVYLWVIGTLAVILVVLVLKYQGSEIFNFVIDKVENWIFKFMDRIAE
jgi:hypothetical protein